MARAVAHGLQRAHQQGAAREDRTWRRLHCACIADHREDWPLHGPLPIRGRQIIEQRWGLAGIEYFLFPSDAGGHYRCKEVFRYMATNLLEHTRARNESAEPTDPKDFGISKTGQAIALEKHGKNEEDQFASEIDQRLRAAETAMEVLTIADLMSIWSAGSICKIKEQAIDIFVEHMPTISKEELVASIPEISTRSFPTGLKQAHQYTWTITDKRRQSLWSKNNKELTAVR